jgi:RND family efflux transporter MFP subunit
MNYDAKIDTAEGEDGGIFNPLAGSDEEERQSRRRMWIGGGLAAILLIGIYLLLHHKDGDALGDDAAVQAPVVTVIAPGRTTIAGRIGATGTLAARRELPVGSAGDGGQVAQVLVEPGQWVKAGQVLAVIDRSVQVEQEASLAAQIQVAQADAALAQANLDRGLKLVSRGFISKADIDRLTATRDAATARVRVSRAQLGEMQARVRRLNIVAPAAGLVLERKIEPGQVVGSGSGVLFRLAKDGEMELLAQLSENDLAALSVGTGAVVTPAGSNKSFTGQVWQISPVIDPQTRQGRARIALAYAPELRPGGFASVDILAGSVVAPLLPEAAILSDAKGSYVYVVGKDNKVQRRPVKTGTVTDSGIAVVSGLDGSERIVQRAGAFLSAGEVVKPRLAEAPKR